MSRTDCEAEGVARQRCVICGEEQEQPAGVSAHRWDSGAVTAEATCAQNGARTYTCDICGETRTENIPAKGHSVVTDAEIPATCTTAGKTEGSHCGVRNEVLVAQTPVAPLGHNWVENPFWNGGGMANATVAPGTFDPGVRTRYYCTRCLAGTDYVVIVINDPSISISNFTSTNGTIGGGIYPNLGGGIIINGTVIGGGSIFTPNNGTTGGTYYPDP